MKHARKHTGINTEALRNKTQCAHGTMALWNYSNMTVVPKLEQNV